MLELKWNLRRIKTYLSSATVNPDGNNFNVLDFVVHLDNVIYDVETSYQEI